MRPNEALLAGPAWLFGRTMAWQVTAAEIAMAAPVLAWQAGLALAGGWTRAAGPAAGAAQAGAPNAEAASPGQAEATPPEPAEAEVDDLA